MAIVLEKYIGNTRIRVHDDLYKNRSEEECRESIRRAFAAADEAEARLARERAEREANTQKA